MKRKLLALLLSFCVALTFLPMGAYAQVGETASAGAKTDEVSQSDPLQYDHNYKTSEWDIEQTGLPSSDDPPQTHDHNDGSGDSFAQSIATLEELKALFESGGSGYLTADITNETTYLSISGKSVSLCLCGYVLDLDACGNIQLSSNASFTLYDCGTEEHYFTVDNVGLWVLTNEKTETIKTVTGGVITGGAGGYGGAKIGSGGAVHISEGCTFTMYGGNLVGNTAESGSGGAVYADGEFNLYGGAICGNVSSFEGGGIYNKAVMRMTGGSITENISSKFGPYNDGTPRYGGGVYNVGTITLGGASVIENNRTGTEVVRSDEQVISSVTAVTNAITNNVKSTGKILLATGADAPRDGMRVGLYASEVEGAVSGQEDFFFADEAGKEPVFREGKVLLAPTVVIKSAPSVGYLIEGETLSSLTLEGGAATLADGTTSVPGSFVWKDGSSTEGGDHTVLFIPTDSNYATAECTVKVTVVSAWKALERVFSGYSYMVPADNSFFTWEGTTDDSGHSTHTVTLKKDIVKKSGEEAINLSGSSYTAVVDLCGYTIDGNSSALFTVSDSGALVLRDSSEGKTGKLIGGNTDRGGAVKVTGGCFTLEGGTITSCEAGEGGGAVYVKNGSFIMLGGTITDCHSRGNGGHGGGAVYVDEYGSFTMRDGTIRDNHITNSGAGGGVYVSSGSRNGSFIMTGGTITDNKTPYSNHLGGGVACYGQATVGGTAVIRGNFQGETLPSDLYIGNPSKYPLHIADGADAPQTGGMEVGICLYQKPSGDNAGIDAGIFSEACADCADCFFPSNPVMCVRYAGGKLSLEAKSMSAKLDTDGIAASYTSLTAQSVTFYVAAYDRDGKMLGVSVRTVSAVIGRNDVALTIPTAQGTVARYRLMMTRSDTHAPLEGALDVSAASPAGQ